MKNYIDVGFMKLFYANYLFHNPEKLTEPDEKGEILQKEMYPIKEHVEKLRGKVAEFDPKTAAKSLLADEEHEEFHEQLLVIDRMGKDEEF
jgi:hypothetical protein